MNNDNRCKKCLGTGYRGRTRQSQAMWYSITKMEHDAVFKTLARGQTPSIVVQICIHCDGTGEEPCSHKWERTGHTKSGGTYQVPVSTPGGNVHYNTYTRTLHEEKCECGETRWV